jgi:hypothetical protein
MGEAMSFYITKASGETEPFSIEKFSRSLKRAGAQPDQIAQIVQEVERIPNLRTTREIYQFAFEALQKHTPHIAARYNLKHALIELGPAGFPFERFVAEIFKRLGYHTEIDVIAHGGCVSHEVDVITTRDTIRRMIECKFRNQLGLKVDVRVTLYIKARFDDLNKKNSPTQTEPPQFHEAMIATNNKFTTQAIQYAECAGLQLLGWSYPAKNSLSELIDRLQLHPITAVTSLSHSQKRACIKNDLVLCNDAPNNAPLFKRLGFSDAEIERLIRECELICKPN